MKVKLFVVIERAISEGINMGIMRAEKYTEPLSDTFRPLLRVNIEREVMNALDEVIDFEEDEKCVE